MARAAGNKRGPRQSFQGQPRQNSPAAQQQQQQQQFRQPIMMPQYNRVAGPQMVNLNQPIMSPRMQQQQMQIHPQQQQQMQMQQQYQMQPQQIQHHPQMQPHAQQPPQFQQQQPPIQYQQQQHLQPQQLQQQLQQPQIARLGNKRLAQEPMGPVVHHSIPSMPNSYMLNEQALRESLIPALEKNMNNHFFSHTLHRTFGPAVAVER